MIERLKGRLSKFDIICHACNNKHCTIRVYRSKDGKLYKMVFTCLSCGETDSIGDSERSGDSRE